MTTDKELTTETLELKIKSLESRIDYLEKRNNMLTALEEAGVDNWVGAEDAYDTLNDEDLVE